MERRTRYATCFRTRSYLLVSILSSGSVDNATFAIGWFIFDCADGLHRAVVSSLATGQHGRSGRRPSPNIQPVEFLLRVSWIRQLD